jgi:hypothetical protein
VKDWLDAHSIPNGEQPLSWREWNTQSAEEVAGPEAAKVKTVVIGFIDDAYVDLILKGDIVECHEDKRLVIVEQGFA